MSAPESHPASVTIWRLLLHLYLQRPPVSPVDATPPVGPLFFSGIIKSRTLAQLKRCILKFIQYHGNRASALKTKQSKTKLQPAVRAKSEPVAVDNSLTKPLSITDLIGVSNESSDSDTGSSQEQNDGSETDVIDEDSSEASDVCHLLAYHVGAERLFCEYLRWLDEGEKTKAMPHDAEIGRFIPDWAFQAAFQQESRYRSASLSPNTEPPPLPLSISPPDAPPPAPPTPLQEAARALLSIRGASRRRSRKLPIRSLLEDVNSKDPRALIALVDEHLKRLQKLSNEWCKEVTTVASLDSALWDLVRGLRVTNDIPVIHSSCLNKCKPLAYAPQERQSCISTGAQQGIVENRNRARSAIRRLARSRPDAARSATALLALARRSGSFETARRMVDRALGCARDVSENCAPAAAALTSFVEIITEVMIMPDV
ncbi:unnamed protein product [Diatraea saccharalis]|uniref:Uncharacterized protein n=1 Tax=Diatraea saccharalis TaxID=40085 RepID=A0A9N9R107_9NEOP|nr:unnamed protein product [Diatraea saccharalis]